MRIDSFRSLLIGLLAVIVLAGASAGCAASPRTEGRSNGGEPFIDDRVAQVILLMKPELWGNLVSRAKSEKYYQTDFWYEDQLVRNVAVRAKGSSSLTYVVEDGSKRLSLKVDFNLLNPFLTFRGLKKLNFHNGYRDPTLMRETLAYKLFRRMDVPAPRTSFVDLWVNDVHMGLYTQVEQVDQVFLARHFERNDGNLYKPIPPGSYLDWTKDDGESGAQRFDNIDYMKLKTNEKNPDHSALLRFVDVLNEESDATFPREIEKVLDVDNALRFLAVQTMLVNLDSYLGRGLNYYLYEVDGRFSLIPWDMNESFGTYKCGLQTEDMIDFLIDEPTCGPVAERPLVDRLLGHEPYRERYHDYLYELLEGPFSIEVMAGQIDALARMIRPYVKQDDLKFHTTEEFEKNLSEDVGRFIGLKRFVMDRGESVRRQLAGELPSSADGAGNGGDPDKA